MMQYHKKNKNYLKAIIICHGSSELCMARHFKSNLRLNIRIDSKDNGKHSIQINSILNHLNKKPYVTEKEFIKKYKNDLPNETLYDDFKIFIIMDTDDEELTSTQIKNYKNKSMFKEHWAYKYIEPIYNTKNLEDVLLKAKIINRNNSKKDYIKIFPISHNAQFNDIEQIQILYNRLTTINNTNMDILLQYFLDIINQ